MNVREDYAKYADIIDLPHHQSVKRPQMSLEARAAQFSPFAALTGYEDAVKETARLTQQRIELDVAEKEALNRSLYEIKNYLQQHPHKRDGLRQEEFQAPVLSVTYFVPDAYKSGGAYVIATGQVRKLKEYEEVLQMEDGTEIPIREILKIECIEL